MLNQDHVEMMTEMQDTHPKTVSDEEAFTLAHRALENSRETGGGFLILTHELDENGEDVIFIMKGNLLYPVYCHMVGSLVRESEKFSTPKSSTYMMKRG